MCSSFNAGQQPQPPQTMNMNQYNLDEMGDLLWNTEEDRLNMEL